MKLFGRSTIIEKIESVSGKAEGDFQLVVDELD
jgi:hypothetical protein